jgi:isopenicillin N synthase-like dioxygenase
MTLPTLDLSRFTEGSEKERQQLASDLLASLSGHGFVKLVNHGIPDKAISRLFGWVSVKDIFSVMKSVD